MNRCGSCLQCCKMLEIQELEKPLNKWCGHVCSTGCGIYENRPRPCRAYQCVWLQTQSMRGAAWPAELRPDRCGVIFEAHETRQDALVARVEKHNLGKLETKSVARVIDSLVSKGVIVVAVTGDPEGSPHRVFQPVIGPNAKGRTAIKVVKVEGKVT